MKTEIMMVTPEMAEKWMENRAVNRRIRENTVIRYAEEMDAGNWHESHEGIAFNEDGKLIDGQHRMLAVALARKPIKFLVARGVNHEALKTMNRGEKRSVADNLTIATGRSTSSHLVAAAHALLKLRNGSKPVYGIDDIEDTLERYAEGFAWASNWIANKRPRGLAALNAVIIRAYYTPKVKRDRLMHVMEVLATGIAQDPDEDYTIIKLRDYLLSREASGERQTLLGYFKIERAMKAALNGDHLTKIHPATSELFPLPDEPVIQPFHGKLFTEMKNRQAKAYAAAKVKKDKKLKKETL